MTLVPALMMQTASAEYPKKPVTLVSPYGPGGAADLAARTVSANATSYLGQGNSLYKRGHYQDAIQQFTFAPVGAPDGINGMFTRRV